MHANGTLDVGNVAVYEAVDNHLRYLPTPPKERFGDRPIEHIGFYTQPTLKPRPKKPSFGMAGLSCTDIPRR